MGRGGSTERGEGNFIILLLLIESVFCWKQLKDRGLRLRRPSWTGEARELDFGDGAELRQ